MLQIFYSNFFFIILKLGSRVSMGACVMLCSRKEIVPPEHEIKYIQSQIKAQLHALQNNQLPNNKQEQDQNTKADEQHDNCAVSMKKSTKTSSKSRFFVERTIKSNKTLKQQEDDCLRQSSFKQKMYDKISIGVDKLDYIEQLNQKMSVQHNYSKIDNIRVQKNRKNLNDPRQVQVIVKNKKKLLFKQIYGKKIKSVNRHKQQVIHKKIKYEDGAVYEGETIQGLRDGKGKYFWDDGTSYDGQWKYDNIQGIGILYFGDGQEYRGQFKINKAHGKGQFCDFNGITYQGQWRFGHEEGKGTENFKNQERYDGEWKAGQKEGYGQLFYFDGSYYKGNFSNNELHGNGQYNWIGKSIYKGSWLHNQKSGIGSIQWQNGDKYEGQFFHDKMHGKGRYYTKDGIIYDGCWQKGRKQGKILQISPSGVIKETIWSFNKKIDQPISRRQSNYIKKILKNSKDSNS